jgi:hypothetical protein
MNTGCSLGRGGSLGKQWGGGEDAWGFVVYIPATNDKRGEEWGRGDLCKYKYVCMYVVLEWRLGVRRLHSPCGCVLTRPSYYSICPSFLGKFFSQLAMQLVAVGMPDLMQVEIKVGVIRARALSY